MTPQQSLDASPRYDSNTGTMMGMPPEMRDYYDGLALAQETVQSSAPLAQRRLEVGRVIQRVATGLLAFVYLGGGSVAPNQEAQALRFDTCFDVADAHNGNRSHIDLIPDAIDHPRTWNQGQSILLEPSFNAQGKAVQDPGPLDSYVRDKVRAAAVKITSRKGYASGFISKDRSGSQVVITAAHVGQPSTVTSIEITDLYGAKSGVAGGCYEYGGEPYPDRSKPSPAAQVDIAILRLTKPLGGTALEFATNEPRRGDWLHFYNFQADRPVSSPAEFNGLVLDQQSSIMDNMVLTGLSGEADPTRHDQTTRPGSSGGVVVNRLGQVAGMSVSSISLPSRAGLFACGVEIAGTPGFERYNSELVVAGMVDGTDIANTIRTGNY